MRHAPPHRPWRAGAVPQDCAFPGMRWRTRSNISSSVPWRRARTRRADSRLAMRRLMRRRSCGVRLGESGCLWSAIGRPTLRFTGGACALQNRHQPQRCSRARRIPGQLSSVETGVYLQEWPHATRCCKLVSPDVVAQELGMHEAVLPALLPAVLPALLPALQQYALAATQTGALQQRRWIQGDSSAADTMRLLLAAAGSIGGITQRAPPAGAGCTPARRGARRR